MIRKLRAAQAWRTRIKRVVVVLSLCLLLSLIFGASRARAWVLYPDWQSGEPVARVSKDHVTHEDGEASLRSCVTQAVNVKDYPSQYVCVMQMKGWRYALYTHMTYAYGVPQSETLFIASLGTDSMFYVVDGLGGSREPLDNPGTDTLIYTSTNWSQISVYRDISRHFERTSTGYRLTEPASVVRYEDGTELTQVGAAIARAGGWLVAETDYGIVRVDVTTLEARLVSTFTSGKPNLFSGSEQLAISDDGQTIFAAGRPYEQRSFAAITVTDSCGVRIPEPLEPAKECPLTDLTEPFNTGSLPDGWPLDFTVSPRGKRLDFYIQGFDGRFSRASLYPYGSAPVKVRYLALGDSFSSGEGDSDRSYYLPHTDNTGETCHTSRRSYPFLLAAKGALEQFNSPISFGVESVACSGATTYDIAADFEAYEGQGGRLLGLSTAVLDQMRTSAMNEFVPGRVRQAEFVDEYQPAALSIGVGGNDVQFSQVLGLCARSLTTCEYAGDPVDRRNLGEAIAGMYPKLVKLYARLTASDPSARIVAVGYPRFINETNRLCPLSTNLDHAERQMIDQGVRYLNSVIEAAAETAGIAYVDVNNALMGYRACDDPGGYVNTINILGTATGRVDTGTFHPNELGQASIALAIERQLGGGDIAAQQYCTTNRYPCPNTIEPPDLPQFFGDASVRPTYAAIPSELIRVIDRTVPYLVTKGAELIIQASLLAAGSTVRIELHSDPFVLATATVGADGTLKDSLVLPASIAPGYHTLHVYGTSPFGEAVDLYQIIYVAEDSNSSQAAGSPSNTQSSDALSVADVKFLKADSPIYVVSKTMKAILNTNRRLEMVLAVVGGICAVGAFIVRRLWRRRPR